MKRLGWILYWSIFAFALIAGLDNIIFQPMPGMIIGIGDLVTCTSMATVALMLNVPKQPKSQVKYEYVDVDVFPQEPLYEQAKQKRFTIEYYGDWK